MKILFLTPWYPDEKIKNHGVFVREQACALAASHRVALVSSKIDYDSFGLSSYELTESEFEGVKEFRIVIKRSLPIVNQLNYFFISRKVSITIARSFQPDVVHGNIGYPGGFWSWLVSMNIKKPFVVTEHTFIQNNFRSFLHKTLTVFSLKRADAVITVSKKSADEISKYTKTGVHVIHNILDTSRFSIQPYPKEGVHIGFVGRLSSGNHVKGLDVLLRSISKIQHDFTLHIAGDGELMGEYKELARQLGVIKKCKFHGFIDYENVPGFLNQLHFFVNSSRFESFGIAIVEAMASGLPVVCFDNGGPGDFVTALNGILVEDQNEDKLTTAVEQMIQNYSTYKRERIRENVMMKFSKEKFVTAMENVYLSATRRFLIKQLP